MTRTDTSEEPPDQNDNQILESLLSRLETLELTVQEVNEENRQLRNNNSALAARLARIERTVSQDLGQRVRTNQLPPRREQRVHMPNGLHPGDLIRVLNSTNPRETFGIVRQATADRVYFRFNGSGRSTWRIYSNIVRVDHQE